MILISHLLFSLIFLFIYLFFFKDDVTPNDIEDYLGEMIENEFDTLFEDGSLLEVNM